MLLFLLDDLSIHYLNLWSFENDFRIFSRLTMFEFLRAFFARLYIWFRLRKLAIVFPFYEIRKNSKDPTKTNLLYPHREWVLESPCAQLETRRDRIFFHGCDPDEGDQLLVVFERLKGGVAKVFILLKIKGRTFSYFKNACLDSSADNIYSSDGFRLECDAPMRRWRLAFNGVMTENDDKVHVRFGIRWSAGGHAFEWPKQLSARDFYNLNSDLPTGALLNAVDRGCSSVHGYDQNGTFYSRVEVDGSLKVEKPLFGGRFKDISRNKIFSAACKHYFGYTNDGSSMHLVSPQGDAKKGTFPICGSVYSVSHFMKPIHSGEVDVSTDNVKLRFKVGDYSYDIDLEAIGDEIPDSDPYSVRSFEGTALIEGLGFKINVFRVEIPERGGSVPLPREFLTKYVRRNTSSPPPLIAASGDDEAGRPELTGGKGSSLAILNTVSRQSESSTGLFSVPRFVILTVKAYRLFAEQQNVREATKNLVDQISAGGDIKEVCLACGEKVAAANLPEQLHKELISALTSTFGTSFESLRFAVRSSAVGEDSEEMSAAGQMTTYLGLQGLDKIESAVSKCWASQFAFTAVQYKRQYGQPVVSEMAVVIQEMVAADAAGVMFTCDPVTANPLRTAVTANFGLGESVVSATAEPDTFILRKNRNGYYDIDELQVGAKSEVIVLDDEDGTRTRKLSRSAAAKPCIDEEMAKRLAGVGDFIDEFFGTCRDIEWATKDGKIYLLQCRPVTSALQESDYEIEHDNNVALRTNRELLSRGNFDEVLPGALPALTSDVMRYFFDTLARYAFIQLKPGVEYERSSYTNLGGFSIGKKWWMNFSEPGLRRNNADLKGIGTSLFGRDISQDEAVVSSICHRRPQKFYTNYLAAFYIIRSLRRTSEALENARRIERDFRLKVDEGMSAEQMIDTIMSEMHKCISSGLHLMQATFPSSIYNAAVPALLGSAIGQESTSPETTALFSRLMKSKHDIESANIPLSLAKLANIIRESSKGEEFCSMSESEALNWLESGHGPAPEAFRTFMKRHGHRCYKEFDLTANPWIIDPEKLVRVLKTSVSAAGTSGVLDEDEEELSVDALPNSPKLLYRLILKWILPKAKFAVYAREATKSSLVFVIHQLRMAFRTLAKRMVYEGRMPSEDLLFFLSVEEIHRLVHRRSPVLVTKAIRRSRIHAKLDKAKFSPLQCGMPKSIQLNPIVVGTDGQAQFKGTPVSAGIIEGIARVINDFESEAHLIQRGEILVTNATDTGWTPYFPLLSGVVTELGGFLSHGAVVAREFGLPAVVGIEGATSYISQGDRILVDGANGIVTKLA